MKFPICLLVLLNHLAPTCAKQPFRMISTIPKNRNLTVDEGESFTLSCRVNKFIRSCVWRHLDKNCYLRWSSEAQGLVKSKCLIFDQKIDVRGDYNKHECQILIHRAMPSDSGLWKCEVREYLTSLAIFATPAVVTQNIHVEIQSPDPVIPISLGPRIGGEETIHEYLGMDEEEREEHQVALIVVSSIFGGFLVVILLLVAVVVLKRYGVLQRASDRHASMRLAEIEEDDFSQVPNGESEKALSQLGVISYTNSRRVF